MINVLSAFYGVPAFLCIVLLTELLKRFLAPEPRCLELFARSLVPGWTSIGLEVLRLQHSYLFEDLEECSSAYHVQ